MDTQTISKGDIIAFSLSNKHTHTNKQDGLKRQKGDIQDQRVHRVRTKRDKNRRSPSQTHPAALRIKQPSEK